jgi:hypothetical protein
MDLIQISLSGHGHLTKDTHKYTHDTGGVAKHGRFYMKHHSIHCGSHTHLLETYIIGEGREVEVIYETDVVE